MEIGNLDIEYKEEGRSEELVVNALVDGIDHDYRYFRQKGSDSEFRNIDGSRAFMEGSEREKNIREAIEKELVEQGYPIQPYSSDVDPPEEGELQIYGSQYIDEISFTTSPRSFHIHTSSTSPPKDEDINEDDIIIEIVDNESSPWKISIEYGGDEPMDWVINTAIRSISPVDSDLKEMPNPEIVKMESRD